MMTVPMAEPIKADNINQRNEIQSSLPRLNNKKLEVATPTHACNLLVPRAASGGAPDSTSAGMVIKPPPPARVSRKPAHRATKNNSNNISAENSTVTPAAEQTNSRVYRVAEYKHRPTLFPLP